MGLSKKDRYVACTDCGCRLEMNGVCKICGHTDIPPLPGMVPDIVGLTELTARPLITHAEAQLKVGAVTYESSETIPLNTVLASTPDAGTQLKIGSLVAIIVSSGPAG